MSDDHCCPTCGRPLFVRHSDRKLEDKDVIYILENPDDKKAIRLANMFGIHESTISKIRNGKAYLDVYTRWMNEKIGSDLEGEQGAPTSE